MIPVILSGGSGSRLWPVSRQSFPKQFCEFLDESLFIKALKRVKPLGSPWTVTVKELSVLTSRSLRELDIPVEQAIYEPVGRNTAPAIAVLCRVFEMQGKVDEVAGIFPADQLVGDDEAFREAVLKGERLAAGGQIVTLGVKPTYPATGYGYIETSTALAGGALQAVGFREKPNESTAREFIARGGFYWNAGMFIFKVKVMIELLRKHVPDIWATVEKLKVDYSNFEEIYAHVRAISIDYAVMEKLKMHTCIPCDFEWNDLGSWDSIAAVLETQSENRDWFVEAGGRSNFVFPMEKKAYGFVGVDDLIVVDTADALLVAKKGSTERVKEVVDQLRGRAVPSATQHAFEVRPWGRFEILKNTGNFKSKTIVVDPGAQLSYQSHAKRAEHWIIIRGTGQVTLDDQTIPVAAGKHVHIPVGAKHRIHNTGPDPLEFVEIQLGTYFGEDDIVRYQDEYRRV